ncbi:M13-type metalloendopeptidase [Zobellia nedashkovskayae]
MRPYECKLTLVLDSPANFRVNGVVSNISEFYTAFNVQKSDSLYLAPEKRVKIW